MKMKNANRQKQNKYRRNGKRASKMVVSNKSIFTIQETIIKRGQK